MTRLDAAHDWIETHREELTSRSLERERAKNSEQVKRYLKARFSDDPAYKRMLGFRQRFTSCLVRKWAGGKEPQRNMQTSQKLFGCSWAQFRAHIEAQFQPRMTWENYGKGPEKWCLDHKRPICLFDWWTWEGLKQAFHWSNVQPLWGWQHRAKTDFDLALGRKRAISDSELKQRLVPKYAPPLEGSREEMMKQLERQLGL